MQQRYADPQSGRLLSNDPKSVNSASGANFDRYWYANDNPYSFTNPDGRGAVKIFIKIVKKIESKDGTFIRKEYLKLVATEKEAVKARLMGQNVFVAGKGSRSVAARIERNASRSIKGELAHNNKDIPHSSESHSHFQPTARKGAGGMEGHTAYGAALSGLAAAVIGPSRVEANGNPEGSMNRTLDEIGDFIDPLQNAREMIDMATGEDGDD